MVLDRPAYVTGQLGCHHDLCWHYHSCCRYDATQPNLAITCTNEGFPVTIADWNDGKCTDFPSVLTFKQWNASLPASCAAPGLAHTIEVGTLSSHLWQSHLLIWDMTMIQRPKPYDSCCLSLFFTSRKWNPHTFGQCSPYLKTGDSPCLAAKRQMACSCKSFSCRSGSLDTWCLSRISNLPCGISQQIVNVQHSEYVCPFSL